MIVIRIYMYDIIQINIFAYNNMLEFSFTNVHHWARHLFCYIFTYYIICTDNYNFAYNINTNKIRKYYIILLSAISSDKDDGNFFTTAKETWQSCKFPYVFSSRTCLHQNYIFVLFSSFLVQCMPLRPCFLSSLFIVVTKTFSINTFICKHTFFAIDFILTTTFYNIYYKTNSTSTIFRAQYCLLPFYYS